MLQVIRRTVIRLFKGLRRERRRNVMQAPSRDRELSVQLGRGVLEATGTWWPFQADGETPSHLVWAGGFVARCRQLLAGMIALVDAAADDTVGVVYRTLLETYLSGTYILLGEADAGEVLARSLLHETHQIEVALGRVKREERPKDAAKLYLSRYETADGLVERVDDLLAQKKSDYAGWAPSIYRNHYRILSLHDAHGGFGSLKGYTGDHEGQPFVVQRREDAKNQAVFLLHHAIAHVGSFAGLWAMEVGHDIGRLQDAMGRWQAAQPSDWRPTTDASGRAPVR